MKICYCEEINEIKHVCNYNGSICNKINNMYILLMLLKMKSYLIWDEESSGGFVATCSTFRGLINVWKRCLAWKGMPYSYLCVAHP